MNPRSWAAGSSWSTRTAFWLNSGIDTRVDDEPLLTLTAYIAQQESQSMSTNIKWGNRRAFENGSVWYRYQNWYAYHEGSDGEPEHVPE